MLFCQKTHKNIKIIIILQLNQPSFADMEKILYNIKSMSLWLHRKQLLTMFIAKHFYNYCYYKVTRKWNDLLPELPEVSIAVPKNSTYSVREAWRTHMEPIRPPAFMKTHSRSAAGKMCPGYFALRSLCTFSNAFFTSNGAVASAYQDTTNNRHILILSLELILPCHTHTTCHGRLAHHAVVWHMRVL